MCQKLFFKFSMSRHAQFDKYYLFPNLNVSNSTIFLEIVFYNWIC